MFTVIQSHRTEKLVTHLLEMYQAKDQPIFEPFVVIVPSMVLGDWLDKTIASQAGISTLVTTKFWGQYQWTLMQEVLSTYNRWLTTNQPDTEVLNVPEVAVLSTTVMQWRLFAYLTFYKNQILNSATDKTPHPVYPLLSALLNDEESGRQNSTQGGEQSVDQVQQDSRLWQLSADIARVFNRYLTHREDWLDKWSNNQPIDVNAMIAEKDALSLQFDKHSTTTPEWLMTHYTELEAAQRHLWVSLFANVYEYRVKLEKRFWQALATLDTNHQAGNHKNNHKKGQQQSQLAKLIQACLPKNLRIFTIQQLPQNELDFLQRLSQYVNITLLHYNPSKLFWSDIVDKAWLQRQQIINPQSVFMREYGHTLLSRLGKQSRETFAMLAGMSGNELHKNMVIDWQDKFEEDANFSGLFSTQTNAKADEVSLLSRLQYDVLMLDETATQQVATAKVSQDMGEQLALAFDDADDKNTDDKNSSGFDNSPDDEFDSSYDEKTLQNKKPNVNRLWSLTAHDNSLSIHSCHSLQRQLEVLRGMIGSWLNEPNLDGSRRHLSDIVVLLPDVDKHHALINAIFIDGKGQDGLTLPAKVTGVVDTSIRQLWQAIIGFYTLLGSVDARFEAPEVLDWLMLPPLYTSFGLTHEQMARGCELLLEAGFVRGFDEVHLKQTLDSHDYDYRFSFAHALDKLVLGLVMPQAQTSDCLYPINWSQLECDLPEKTLPMAGVSLADAPIIETLCRIHQGLADRRFDHLKSQKAEAWLNQIETQVIHRYFGDIDQNRSMRAIYNAMNGFKSSLRANRHYGRYSPATHNNSLHNNPLHNNPPNSNSLHSNPPHNGNASSAEDNVKMAGIEQQLSKVESLPLKLSFMLDSIEDELESQQVSAEPTGVITFGRFGALRNVPFGLVVMLNMNLSEFPNRDKDNRYDLMKAGLARRGDRFSEDDDNGAFLDALLCARSACWIFYNGKSLTDTHEHLPATPVSELIQFLQGEVAWQWQPIDNLSKNAGQDANKEATDLAKQLSHYMPKLVSQWLVTEHSALPFARDVFESSIDIDGMNHSGNSNDGVTNEGINKGVSEGIIEVTSDADETLDSRADNGYDDDGEGDSNDYWRELLELAMQRTKIKQKMAYPPAQIWQSVYGTLSQRNLQNKPSGSLPPVVNLPTQHDYELMALILADNADLNVKAALTADLTANFAKLLGMAEQTPSASPQLLKTHIKNSIFDIENIDIEALRLQVKHPGKTFLRAQKVFVVQAEEGISRQEPLALDNLTKYQVNEQLINYLKQINDNDAVMNDTTTVSNSATNNSAINNSATDNSAVNSAMDYERLAYQNIIPAGVARYTTLPKHQAQLIGQCQTLNQRLIDAGVQLNFSQSDTPTKNITLLNLLTPTSEQSCQVNLHEVLAQRANPSNPSNQPSSLSHFIDYLPEYIELKGTAPTPTAPTAFAATQPHIWLNILPNSARLEHLLRFWLMHLYWQIVRHQHSQQPEQLNLHSQNNHDAHDAGGGFKSGSSIWQFNKACSSSIKDFKDNDVFVLPPIGYTQAVLELAKWALFANLSGHVPNTLMPDYALTYIEMLNRANKKQEAYYPKRNDFKSWLETNDFMNNNIIYDTCSKHPIWQYILQGQHSQQDAFASLTPALLTLAQPLYGAMYDALTPLK